MDTKTAKSDREIQLVEGQENFRRLVAGWALQARDEGLPYPILSELSEAAVGHELSLTPSYLSSIVKGGDRSPTPTFKRVVAIAETNKLIERIQHGEILPLRMSWMKVKPITVNGQIADTACLSQVISGEIIPEEAHRWIEDYENLPANLETGLARLFKRFEAKAVLDAYPVDNRDRRNLILAVLMGLDSIPREDVRSEFAALAHTWEKLTGEPISPDRLIQKALDAGR